MSQLSTIRILVAVSMLITGASLAYPQSDTPLTITSPANDTLVAPGQQLSITVQNRSGSPIQMVGLISQDPFPSTGPQFGTGPYSFAVSIPETLSPGRYSVMAVGANGFGTGIGAVSSPILFGSNLDCPSTNYEFPLRP